MTTYYSALPQETVVRIYRSVNGMESFSFSEMTVKEANESHSWSTSSGTVGVTAVIVGSKDTLNTNDKDAEISVALIDGIPCARTGFNHSDGKNRHVIEKGFWCQEDMPELKKPWELL